MCTSFGLMSIKTRRHSEGLVSLGLCGESSNIGLFQQTLGQEYFVRCSCLDQFHAHVLQEILPSSTSLLPVDSCQGSEGCYTISLIESRRSHSEILVLPAINACICQPSTLAPSHELSISPTLSRRLLRRWQYLLLHHQDAV